jgi:FkbH-like protein
MFKSWSISSVQSQIDATFCESGMSTSLYRDLLWLPRSPADFNSRCRALMNSDVECGLQLKALASHALDENQLNQLAKVISAVKKSPAALKPLAPFRLGLLSNSTVDFMVPAAVATAARHGIALECISANYDQVIQEALSPTSVINRANANAILIAIDYRALALNAKLSSQEDSDAAVERALSYVDTVRNGLKAHSKAICIVQNFAAPPERLFGSLDRVVPGTLRNTIDRVNSRLAQTITGTGDLLLDVAGIAETVGLENWHSPPEWNLAKLPFSNSYLPLYSDHLARLIAAVRGKSRRVLVLDLDNTVWGGVIGDDGLEGIACAQGDATGEAHLSVQRLALELRERGIAIAVSSKNNDEVARLPFREHREMLLKEEHIAVFQANWNDKATNIRAIAKELALGTDSMVFLDDNPVERNLVREMLPDVAVPELPSDPALYARTLAAAGYFEAVVFSDEDIKRAGYYQDNAKRVELEKQADDIDGYLKTLRMEITFQPFDATGRARITQLINKSNQFNLTTKRYTEAEVAAAEDNRECFTLQVRLADAYGDNGMISVVICRLMEPTVWEFDTWLMSCRVLGRRVEQMVLKQIISQAVPRGIRRLVGVYIPTDRNQLVQHHYSNLGFSQIGGHEGGSTVWELDVENAHIEDAAMTVHTVGFG